MRHRIRALIASSIAIALAACGGADSPAGDGKVGASLTNVGAIAGTVDSTLVTAGCMPKVYVYRGADIVPDDMEEAGSAARDMDPLLVEDVSVANGSILYPYSAAFLKPGAYTVGFTCGADDPTSDEALTFLASRSVTVRANLISVANFVHAVH
jgi:hypothetical protein